MTDEQGTALKMTAEEIAEFLDEHFPQVKHLDLDIERVDLDGMRIRLPVKEMHLRPGGTVSGATLMTLADATMYLTVLSRIGPVAQAVTTNLNINFLRRPGQVDVIAECRLLRLGQRLAVGEVILFSEGKSEPVAQATLTYSIPPEKDDD